eukprot:TRINITY_DN28428_c0_g1_i1.p1 TRINITY_DN28428_c0_g1~~TRINITY_DN28428_c0_g1_i1.p1  ORF type:complete len:427 (+),score=54.88 TRINITY_DN28428_c0_g1_i1:89-1369(+)
MAQALKEDTVELLHLEEDSLEHGQPRRGRAFIAAIVSAGLLLVALVASVRVFVVGKDNQQAGGEGRKEVRLRELSTWNKHDAGVIVDVRLTEGSCLYDCASNSVENGFCYSRVGIAPGSDLNGDLNQGAGGADIFLCISHGEKPSAIPREKYWFSPITDLLVSTSCPAQGTTDVEWRPATGGTSQIWYNKFAGVTQDVSAEDLNAGAGGETINLCHQHDTSNGNPPITGLMLTDGSCPEPFERVKTGGGLNGDLNQGSGGRDIFLCQTTRDKWYHCSEGPRGLHGGDCYSFYFGQTEPFTNFNAANGYADTDADAQRFCLSWDSNAGQDAAKVFGVGKCPDWHFCRAGRYGKCYSFFHGCTDCGTDSYNTMADSDVSVNKFCTGWEENKGKPYTPWAPGFESQAIFGPGKCRKFMKPQYGDSASSR